MTCIQVEPGKLSGKIPAIPSKSDAHRKLVCASQSNSPSALLLTGCSKDIQATIQCLITLGAKIEEIESGLRIVPIPKPFNPVKSPLELNCGESGSTLRFIVPLAATLGGAYSFSGEGRLSQRPMAPLCSALAANGCELSHPGEWPIQLQGKLISGLFALPGNISSQFFSGLLMALPNVEGSSTLRTATTLESAEYVEMTIQTLAQFGIQIFAENNGWQIPGGQTFTTQEQIQVEGDWSNAAFWFAAGALGHEIHISGLDPHSSQPDRRICEWLRQAGAIIREEENCFISAPANLHAISIDASESPDLIPIWSVLSAVSEGVTHICHAERLRLKESNRIKAIHSMILSLGGVIRETPDGLEIRGKPFLSGGTVSSENDHRIAMSAAIASLVSKDRVTIHHAEAVNKSYPSFFKDFESLGGHFHVVNDRQ